MSYLDHPAIRQILDEDVGEPSSGMWNPDRELIANRIVNVLRVYPKISPSMLQQGIGASIPADLWRPIWNILLEKGIVKQEQMQQLSVSGRMITHTLLSLVDINVIEDRVKQLLAEPESRSNQ